MKPLILKYPQKLILFNYYNFIKMFKFFKLSIVIFFSTFFLYACKTNTLVKVNGIDYLKKEGIYYALPKTMVEFQVKIEKTIYKKGIYADFAKEYLGLNIEKYDTLSYSINEIKPIFSTVVDTSNLYHLKMKTKQRIQLSVYLTAKDFQNISFIKPIENQIKLDSVEHKGITAIYNSNYLLMNNMQSVKLDTLMRIVKKDSTWVEEQFIKSTLKNKNPKDLAKETAEKIIKLREYKLMLTNGSIEVPYSSQSLAFMIEYINNVENYLTSLFIGYKYSQIESYSIILNAETYVNNSKNIFFFSNNFGIATNRINEDFKSVNYIINVNPPLYKMSSFPENILTKGMKGIYYRPYLKCNSSVIIDNKAINRIDCGLFLSNVNYLENYSYKVLINLLNRRSIIVLK